MFLKIDTRTWLKVMCFYSNFFLISACRRIKLKRNHSKLPNLLSIYAYSKDAYSIWWLLDSLVRKLPVFSSRSGNDPCVLSWTASQATDSSDFVRSPPTDTWVYYYRFHSVQCHSVYSVIVYSVIVYSVPPKWPSDIIHCSIVPLGQGRSRRSS